MTVNLDHIHIFKTNIRTESDKLRVKESLAIPLIHDWHVDTEDVDCVLRVVTPHLSPQEIIHAVTRSGYLCTELE